MWYYQTNEVSLIITSCNQNARFLNVLQYCMQRLPEPPTKSGLFNCRFSENLSHNVRVISTFQISIIVNFLSPNFEPASPKSSDYRARPLTIRPLTLFSETFFEANCIYVNAVYWIVHTIFVYSRYNVLYSKVQFYQLVAENVVCKTLRNWVFFVTRSPFNDKNSPIYHHVAKITIFDTRKCRNFN